MKFHKEDLLLDQGEHFLLGKAPPQNWRRRGGPTLAHPRKIKERRRRTPWTVGGIETEWEP